LKGKDYPEKTRPELEYDIKLDFERKEKNMCLWTGSTGRVDGCLNT
jgi:hypothetical protein